MQKHLTFLIALFIGCSSLAQVNLDSLWNVWNDKTQADTSRLKAMNKIAWYGYLFSKPDSAFYFAQLQYDFAESVNNKKWMANSLNIQGASFYLKGDYPKALDYYTRGLKINEEIGDKQGIADLLNNIGAINVQQGDYTKALDYYTRGLKINEEIGDKYGIASSLNNIGIIYYDQGYYAKAKDYYTKSLKIYKELGDKYGISGLLANIGIIYKIQGNYPKAIDCQARSLKMAKEIENKDGIAKSLNNIGDIYLKQGDYHKALKKSSESLSIAQEIGNVLNIKDASESLWQINKKLGKHRPALEMHELYIQMRDSILSIENKEAIIHQRFKYEYEKEQALADAKHNELMHIKSEKIKIQNQKIEKERVIKYSLFIGMLIVIASLFVIFKNLRKTKLQKILIETQHKDLTASINYAKKIQNAILPEEDLIKEFFSEHFVLFQPKDIVGGDFYWYRCFGDLAVIACVDCTGHGVPGGFMSMMGSLLLNKLIHNNQLYPSDILEQLSNDIIRVLKQDAEGEIQDGMDMSLCMVDKKNMKLHFSGARNGIIIIDKENISSYKADLLPVGGAFPRKRRKMNRKFTTQTISITKDSWIIMYSDGYYDQLGGGKVMSMEPKKYKEIIQSAVKSNKDKKEFLMTEFEKWKGDFPQVDDLLVIGLRV
jgi:tetratricopeptide (TPR) repeat protein